MATIRTAIELEDHFSNILNNIVLKYAADANQSNENSPNSHMESSYSLDDLVKLDSP